MTKFKFGDAVVIPQFAKISCPPNLIAIRYVVMRNVTFTYMIYYYCGILLLAIQSNYDIYSKYWIEDILWGTPTFVEHINDLCKPGNWGTQVELQACNDCMYVSIFILLCCAKCDDWKHCTLTTQ